MLIYVCYMNVNRMSAVTGISNPRVTLLRGYGGKSCCNDFYGIQVRGVWGKEDH